MYNKSIAIAATALILAGCSRNSSPVTAANPPLAISPADGETGVRLDAAISLEFIRPVDPAVVQRDLHLISERAMADSLCPVSTTMDHGDMMTTMSDTAKMHHLDQTHSMRGRFLWNSDNTRCVFTPDTIMTPKTQYMIHLGQEMVGMMENRLGDMRMMAGHGSGMMAREMMLHFWTLDTTQAGSSHSGHH